MWYKLQIVSTLDIDDNLMDDEKPNGRGNKCFPHDSIVCLTLAVVVGAVLLLVEATIITLILVFPSSVGLAPESFLTPGQRHAVGIATLLMMIESIVIGATDVCKYLRPLSSFRYNVILQGGRGGTLCINKTRNGRFAKLVT